MTLSPTTFARTTLPVRLFPTEVSRMLPEVVSVSVPLLVTLPKLTIEVAEASVVLTVRFRVKGFDRITGPAELIRTSVALPPVNVTVLLVGPTVLTVTLPLVTLPGVNVTFELATTMSTLPFTSVIVPPNEFELLLRFVPKPLLLLELYVDELVRVMTPLPVSAMLPELARKFAVVATIGPVIKT